MPFSAAHQHLMEFRITCALKLDMRRRILDCAEILRRQIHVEGSEILFKAVEFRCAGIGTIHGFFASSQASATCAGVACFFSANVVTKFTRAWFAFRFSSLKRGMVLRKSVLSNFVSDVILPVRKPLPSGLNGTN